MFLVWTHILVVLWAVIWEEESCLYFQWDTNISACSQGQVAASMLSDLDSGKQIAHTGLRDRRDLMVSLPALFLMRERNLGQRLGMLNRGFVAEESDHFGRWGVVLSKTNKNQKKRDRTDDGIKVKWRTRSSWWPLQQTYDTLYWSTLLC